MLESRPPHARGTLFGYALVAGIILLDAGLLLLLASQPVSFLSFLWGALLLASLPAVAFISFWASALPTARYHVEGEALVIEWGRIRNVVPLAVIRSLVSGDSGIEIRRFRGLCWPGCYVGYGYADIAQQGIEQLETLFFATRPPKQQLLLVTDTAAYGVSPSDLDNFADCLEALRPSQSSDYASTPTPATGFLQWHFWRDRRAQILLAIPILLNGALFAFLCMIFGRLPVAVPMHFDGAGMVDRLTSPANLFVLPFIGLLTWLMNFAVGWIFYWERNERPLATLLWTATVGVQLTTWVALVGLLA